MNKAILSALVSCVLLSGCVTSGPEFSWYHPMGGELLFAYDKGECEQAVAAQRLRLDANTDGPFFHCMHERGYYLVDADGTLHGPVAATTAVTQTLSAQ